MVLERREVAMLTPSALARFSFCQLSLVAQPPLPLKSKGPMRVVRIARQHAFVLTGSRVTLNPLQVLTSRYSLKVSKQFSFSHKTVIDSNICNRKQPLFVNFGMNCVTLTLAIVKDYSLR